MIKLIVTDVDDTLVPEGSSQLNPEYFQIFREFRKRGIMIGVASGRQKPCLCNMFAPILDEIFVLAENGTVTWSRDFESADLIPDEMYEELVQDLRKYKDYGIMSCKPDVGLFEKDAKDYYDHMLSYPYVCQYSEDLSKEREICKISLWNPRGIEPEVAEALQKTWENRLHVCMAGQCFFDFMPQGSNKGTALAHMQDHLGILPEETVAFGNADNDVEMLNRAKYSYGVAGASQKLKEAASQIIGPMEEEGVLSKLREILAEIDG